MIAERVRVNNDSPLGDSPCGRAIPRAMVSFAHAGNLPSLRLKVDKAVGR
jgi:hypothetical protein